MLKNYSGIKTYIKKKKNRNCMEYYSQYCEKNEHL